MLSYSPGTKFIIIDSFIVLLASVSANSASYIHTFVFVLFCFLFLFIYYLMARAAT